MRNTCMKKSCAYKQAFEVFLLRLKFNSNNFFQDSWPMNQGTTFLKFPKVKLTFYSQIEFDCNNFFECFFKSLKFWKI